MIAAVALLSFAYFSIIELMAFSYAISGCSCSMSEIQIERKPFQRFPSLENSPISPSVLCRFVQLRRVAHHARYGFLSEEFEHFLHVELLLVAGADHALLLGNPILHHRLQFYDFFFILFDALVGFGGHLVRIRGALPDVGLEGLARQTRAARPSRSAS